MRRRSPVLSVVAFAALTACTTTDVVAVPSRLPADSGVDASVDARSGCPGPVVLPGLARRCSTSLARERFVAGVCGCQYAPGVTSSGDLRIDAFDSTVGPYDGSAANLGGTLGSNDTVRLAGSTVITGPATVVSPAGLSFQGPADSLTIDGVLSVYAPLVDAAQTAIVIARSDVYVDGVIRLDTLDVAGVFHHPSSETMYITNATFRGGVVDEGVNPVFPCPCTNRIALDIPGIVADAAIENENASIGLAPDALTNPVAAKTLTLPCGRYYLESITSSVPVAIVATGHVALFVERSVDVLPLTISIAAGASLDLFVGDTIALASPSRIGDPANPSSLRIYVGGASSIAVESGAVLAGEVLTNGSLALPSGFELHGGLIGPDIVLGGGVEVHEDLSVRSLPACLVP